MSDDDISSLKLQVFELKAEITATNIRLRALQDALAVIYKENTNPPLEHNEFRSALKEMESERANEVLRSYADTDPTMASILKKYLDQHFPPNGEND